MKKKNLIILLLIPFLIALLGVVTIRTTYSIVDNDIVSIDWDYNDIEGFKLGSGKIKLQATGVNQRNYPAGVGNNLVWTLHNKDENDVIEHAKITKDDNNNYYLETLNEGSVILVCANEKGNVSRSFEAVIYENCAILLNTKIKKPQTEQIDQTIYYGTYDLVDGQKVNAVINLQIDVLPADMKSSIKVLEQTSNIKLDLDSETIEILDDGSSFVTIGFDDNLALSQTFSFYAVKDGINVYTYDDLLACTNKSDSGEIVVLRKSFESIENAYYWEEAKNNTLVATSLKNNNVECFGHYDLNNSYYDIEDKKYVSKFHFEDEIYQTKTTYNTAFIDQWNEFVKTSNQYQAITKNLKVGLHVQKDFYGNGYTINMHNLTYPSELTLKDGILVAKLGSNDLFRGPLPFYSLGDHNDAALIEALGQDNIGMYVDGDNITVNDLNLKNCDFGNILYNLNYVGTVMEINGKNITIQNSLLANGRQVIRAFNASSLLIDNCMISFARNFLVHLGSNDYETFDENKVLSFFNNNQNTSSTIKDYLAKDAIGDTILSDFIRNNFTDKEMMKKALLSIQDALSFPLKDNNDYHTTVKINNTLFYTSGVASIGIDNMFNGPFLYNSSPSFLNDNFYAGMGLKDLVPYEATNVGGASYPVKLEILGSTKFYDYKTEPSMDISGLINENMSEFAKAVGFDKDINIDTVFPLKKIVYQEATNKRYAYKYKDDTYVNVAIAFYGGSFNNSLLLTDNFKDYYRLGEEMPVDLLDYYLNLQDNNSQFGAIKNQIFKCVPTVTGYEPFRFVCLRGDGYLFGDAPRVLELINNAKENKE